MYVNEIVPLALAMGSCPTTFITLMGRVHCLGMHFLLKVASESAAALAYMHSSVDSLKPIMLHGNVNSSNILLTDCFVANVSGFGPSRPENQRIITSHFVSSVEQNDIFQIVVAQLVNEGNREQLRAVAELAKSCIKLSSAEGPAMEEAAIELRRLCGGTHYPKPVSSCRQLLSENPL
ncbi:hypothetical protein ACFX2F_002211 [Malus domestica]